MPQAGEGGFISTNPTAIGTGDSGYHLLGLTCLNGRTTLFIMGYPASPGEANETIRITVDGTAQDLPVRHRRPDGLFIGAAPAAVVEALRRGNSAQVRVPGEVPISYALRGSSQAIGSAISDCSTETEPSAATTSVPATLDASLRAACSGDYTLKDFAVRPSGSVRAII